MKRSYRYYCVARPPVPGAIPRGVTRVMCADDDEQIVDEEGHVIKCWGFVEYDRPLTDQEIDDYELERG